MEVTRGERPPPRHSTEGLKARVTQFAIKVTGDELERAVKPVTQGSTAHAI